MRRHRPVIAAAAFAAAFIAPSIGWAQVAPPVVTVTATDGTLTATEGCDGAITYDLDPAVFTFTRSGDATDELFVDTAAAGSTIEQIFNPVEGVEIPAGEASSTFEPDTGTATGTVQIEIADVTFPGSFVVGDPSVAVATVTRLDVVADCPATSTTTAPTAPPSTAPAAEAVEGAPAFTG